LADAMIAEFKERRDPRQQRTRAAEFSPDRAADAYLAALLGGRGNRGEAVAELETETVACSGN
jgi:hypothetical protein